ncbi:hypothetical protein BKA67DRAFT_539971 [Truncatella angustata]|uniref:Uncharacterized protein n=1 Tax=Truncatella angustata TaxID=152316 RepID=A0A9P8ZUM7_9PEZI|nr:uncharacterized protein BKA67DRAFT_539971 [Truncatella angustata]KAH6648154.1 hypothetical protein BKA67DRAFT_539971 [Truncatella angustata]KAH8201420.1 hypothetical protein TruAng_004420 [Truncatella angustata]
MFLHSGASLHGHEYSNRDPPATGHASPRRNSLLRSSFGTPITRSPPKDSRSPSPSIRTTSLKKVRPRPVSDFSPAPPEHVVRFLEPVEHELVPASTPEEMSEDESSTIVDISDSDTSRAASSTRRQRRLSTRQRTAYLLAQAPPTLNKKQRLLHIRPKLLLQLQQVPAGQRPVPAIDVYPSSGIVNTAIAAHLCRRFPRLSRIKSEKSIQDVLLLKSEDYTASENDSDSDGDEESIKNRDIIAILSPLSGQDKAEIALPDGTVWVAAPRLNGYEFTTIDKHGITTTARWIRRQTKSISTMPLTPPTSAPSSPLSPSSITASAFPFPGSSSPDCKFIFSFVDPSSRQHPIMATLQPSSLDISDTYTTVSRSCSKHPPTSTQRRRTIGAEDEKESAHQRTTRVVEDWQKSFIQISALWVALRNGWVPRFKPADFIPQNASTASLASTKVPKRTRSYTTGSDVGTPTVPRNLTGRWRHSQPPLQEVSTFSPGILPRRATSTGAARMKRLNAERISEVTEISDTSSTRSKGRRVLSGEWNLIHRHSTALSGIADLETIPNEGQSANKPTASTLVSPGVVTPSKRPVSDFITTTPMRPPSPTKNAVSNGADGRRPNLLNQSRGIVTHDETDQSRKRHRWKSSVSKWFNKLRAR